MICNTCKKEIPDDSDFCPLCGHKQIIHTKDNAMTGEYYCEKCGMIIPRDSLYCPKCGEPQPNMGRQETHNEGLNKDNSRIAKIVISGLVTTAIILLIISTFIIISRRKNNRTFDINNTEVSVNDIAKEKKQEKKESEKKANKKKTEVNESVLDSQDEDTDRVAPIAVVSNTKQAKIALSEINDDLRDFIWVTLMVRSPESLVNEGDRIGIVLNDSEMIRAAVLASDPDGAVDDMFANHNGKIELDKKAGTGPNGTGFHGKSVSKQDVESYCRNLFGTDANWDELQDKEQCEVYDAVKYLDSTGTHAIKLDAEVETDTDIETHEIRVEEVKGEYFGEVDLFFGYWGLLSQNPEYSNYRITYELVPDENSKYGIRVSSISIQRIANEQTSDQDTEPTPFYGIWCTASKDSDEAMESANQLIEKGFDGKVYYTLHWGNLNNEPYYVVTAGTYLNEEEAKANLAEVQSKGYPKAYVKYSGEYLMN